MGLLESGRWFDDLSQQEQTAIRNERGKFQTITRLIPLDHGSTMETQLEAGKQRFLACRDPFCLIRVSDCEIGLLGAGYLPSQRLNNIFWHYRIAGFSTDALYLQKQFISAIREAQLVGLQQNWLPVMEDTGVLFNLLDIPTPLPNGVEVHLPYKLLVDGTLLRYLAGKKILVVGTLAPALQAALRDPGFIQAHAQFGDLGKLQITGVIRTKAREEGGAWVDFQRVLDEAAKVDYDVALLSCGVTAKPLCWNLWKRGKTALDIGFVVDALLGDPERKLRPVFKNVAWGGGDHRRPR